MPLAHITAPQHGDVAGTRAMSQFDLSVASDRKFLESRIRSRQPDAPIPSMARLGQARVQTAEMFHEKDAAGYDVLRNPDRGI